MVIIDPEGMFCGDRMAQLSDQAKTLWPWLYLASNGYGRLEINYRRLLNRVFAGFTEPPAEQTVMSCVQEYSSAYLLFLYTVNGQIWGQWDTSEKYLPRHKTAADKRSPEPPAEDFAQWKNAYAESKKSKVAVLATISENFQTLPKTDAKVGENLRVVVGVGVGADVGVGAQDVLFSPLASDTCPADALETAIEKPVSQETVKKPLDGAAFLKAIGWEGGWKFIRKAKADQIAAISALRGWQVDQAEDSLDSLTMIWIRLDRFEEFWTEYWRKSDKKEARIAYFERVQTLELHERIIAAVEAQRPAMLAKDEQYRPLGATWLNKERWEDESSMQPESSLWSVN